MFHILYMILGCDSSAHKNPDTGAVEIRSAVFILKSASGGSGESRGYPNCKACTVFSASRDDCPSSGVGHRYPSGSCQVLYLIPAIHLAFGLLSFNAFTVHYRTAFSYHGEGTNTHNSLVSSMYKT